ncbi:MAG TPA: glycosyltransferase [Thermoanaerobaculia bacterium]|nr:glycosyltransferase [Thermoanaerobaculia bacterium]
MRSLAVFFSHGISLARWRAGGLMAREVGYYRELSRYAGPVTFVTYDTASAELAGDLATIAPFTALWNTLKLPYQLFGFLAPLLHWRRLRQQCVLKTNQISGAWTAVIAKWLTRRPLVVRCGYVPTRNLLRAGASARRLRVARAIERFVMRAANLVFVATEADRQYVLEQRYVAAGKLHVIPTPIDVERFAPVSTVRDPELVLYVGRLSPEKNIDLIIDAALRTGVKLEIIGSGALEASLKQRAASGRVSFLGTVSNDQLPAHLARASIFIMASDYEGSPKALLEAMACGVAVIGTNVQGIRDAIDDGVTGLLCEKDAASIAAAITRLRDDGALAARLGTAARERVVRFYSQTEIARREGELLASLAC